MQLCSRPLETKDGIKPTQLFGEPPAAAAPQASCAADHLHGIMGLWALWSCGVAKPNDLHPVALCCLCSQQCGPAYKTHRLTPHVLRTPAGRNKAVDEVNQAELDKLPGAATSFASIDGVDVDQVLLQVGGPLQP